MRFADEPAERAPSRQMTRPGSDDARRSIGVEKGEFDRALEWLTDADKDDDGDE